jgi:VWFA-related protein
MTRWIRVLVLVAAAVALQASNASAQADEISVYASVVDKSDTPVTGLGVGDFIVREDGVSREVLRVSATNEPMTIAVLVDTGAAIEPHLLDLRRSLLGFFKTMAGKNDIAVIGTGERPTVIQDYTQNLALLEKALGAIYPRTGSGTYLLEALEDASGALRRRKAQRPTIVIISTQGTEFGERHHDGVLAQLRESGVAVHSLVLTSRGIMDRREDLELEQVVDEGTRNTGGRRDEVLTSMALGDRLQKLANELNSQYRVTYARTKSLLPPKSLEVSVKRPDLTVRARRWP